MNIPKAIETNEDTLHQYEKHLLSVQRDALKLGIEALKVVRDNRDPDHAIYIRKLPSETED